ANKGDGGYFNHLVSSLADRAISKHEIVKRVDSFMARRFEGAALDIARLGIRTGGREHMLLSRLADARAHGKRVFALFPNVMWDNATTFKEWNRVFDSPVQWLIETVDYFKQSQDKILVIRVHPAEYSWMPVRKSIRDVLCLHFGPEIFYSRNIILIDPEEPLSSYRLFEYLDGATVYNGTIGIELILHNVPLILGARAAYSDKGFTRDVDSRAAYFAGFDDTDKILAHQNANLELAKIFAYEYFFTHGVPVRFLSATGQLTPNFDGDPHDMWNDPNLDHIISVIEGRRRFFQDHWLEEQLVAQHE
ncbi:MAG: hypothetical protein AB1744_14940, partial [Candidatus Zixiibacteriota bacterium]